MTSKDKKSLMDTLYDMVMSAARDDKGATYPNLCSWGDHAVCVLDTDTGKVYELEIKLREVK